MNKEYISFVSTEIIKKTNTPDNIRCMEVKLQHSNKTIGEFRSRLCNMHQLYEKAQEENKATCIRINKLEKSIKKNNIHDKIDIMEENITLLNEFVKKFDIDNI